MTRYAKALQNWPQTAAEAIEVQKLLRGQLVLHDTFDALRAVAGVDVAYDIQSNISHAVAVLMRLDELKPIAVVRAQLPTIFPYIPGFLSFREIPVVLAALEKLPEVPDLLMVDGQGIAHPRRMGIAAHLGVLLDMPSIGVAKSLLCGTYDEPALIKGARSVLIHKNEQIGVVLRSKDRVKPLFISPGHRVGMETAVELVQRCLIKHRLPEPTRIADKYSKDRGMVLPVEETLLL